MSPLLIYSFYGMERRKTLYLSLCPRLLFGRLFLTSITSLNTFMAHPCKQLGWQKMQTTPWDRHSPFLFRPGIATCFSTAL